MLHAFWVEAQNVRMWSFDVALICIAGISSTRYWSRKLWLDHQTRHMYFRNLFLHNQWYKNWINLILDERDDDFPSSAQEAEAAELHGPSGGRNEAQGWHAKEALRYPNIIAGKLKSLTSYHESNGDDEFGIKVLDLLGKLNSGVGRVGSVSHGPEDNDAWDTEET
ncbi:hypothetical protein NE237_032064 [Protea cynaroides]|uniref:Uncharacterized protein n=1 Tax=Protea cynaroides TaxID=273540 RepID=A0A9Q0L2K6_9MAGN|nr:hypothetical protein NE237_032064 [Protea cynaroides]